MINPNLLLPAAGEFGSSAAIRCGVWSAEKPYDKEGGEKVGAVPGRIITNVG